MTSPKQNDKKRKLYEVCSSSADLVDSSEFIKMNNEMHEYDEKREVIIKKSREILKNSKQSIYALHRGSVAEAKKLLADADKLIPELVALTASNPSLRQGSLSSALEEYVEAQCFRHYLETSRLIRLSQMPLVVKEEYLGGIIDFTGELCRYAIVKATKRDQEEVEKCRRIVEAISGELIQFDFRNGPLRKKYDSIKYNLRKLENTLYELSLVGTSGITVKPDVVESEAPSAEDNK